MSDYDDLPAPAGLSLLAQGKVRRLYQCPHDQVLIIASDRISAFDVVFPESILAKGEVLTRISNFWFEQSKGLVNSHYLDNQDVRLKDLLTEDDYSRLAKRSMLARSARPLRIEAIVRGYLEGSAWLEYQGSQTVGGQRLPTGLRRYDRLPSPVFTPTSKAEDGGKDISIDQQQASQLVGTSNYDAIHQISLRLFEFATKLAFDRGLLLCDTKFEFGIDADGELMLIDEMLTPDSSRYWLKEDYDQGQPQPMDKQFLRDHLRAQGFSGSGLIPPLEPQLIETLIERYRLLMRRLLEVSA